MARIALVTEELSNYGLSGGIGVAFRELSILLAHLGHNVDLIYVNPNSQSLEKQNGAKEYYGNYGVNIIFPDLTDWIWNPNDYTCKLYAISKYLEAEDYDYIHFHDYKGYAFFVLEAKRLGFAFQDTVIILQLHGPTTWTIDMNNTICSSYEQALTEYIEKKCIEWADVLVSPSAYLVDWLSTKGLKLPPKDKIHVIQNCRSPYIYENIAVNESENIKVAQIAMFGRHEERKGLNIFINALKIIEKDLVKQNINICFIGKSQLTELSHSGIVISESFSKSSLNVDLHINWDSDSAKKYIRKANETLFIVPSLAENSPYSVVEVIAEGRDVICSIDGGAYELFADDEVSKHCVKMDAESLAKAILERVNSGIRTPHFKYSNSDIINQWGEFHKDKSLYLKDKEISEEEDMPKVVFGITHHERADKLIISLFSAIRQTYKNIEIVVCDDGSKSKETIEKLEAIEELLNKVGGKLIRRENGYLGAARNSIIKSTDADYYIFLDDDDIALPDLTEKMVKAIKSSKTDCVVALNSYMELNQRDNYEVFPTRHNLKVSYVPIGGPLSLAAVRNVFGACTSIISRKAIDKIGGYTELKGVGHEDYEFYVRMLQAGCTIDIAPYVGYLYEVGRPSMISTTSSIRNFKRISDSINLSQNTEEFRRFYEVASYSIANETAQNRRSYYNTLDKKGQLAAKIIDARISNNIDLECNLLSQYCRTYLSNENLAYSWEKAHVGVNEILNAPTTTDANYNLPSINKNKLTESKNVYDLEIFRIKLQLAEKKYDGVREYISSRIINYGVISSFEETLVNSLIIENEIDNKLLNVLSFYYQSQAKPKLEDEINTFNASVIFKLSKSNNKSNELIEEIKEYTLDQYLDYNVDVKDALDDKANFNTILIHYLRHGVKEKRQGFELLKNLSDMYSSYKKRNIPINKLFKEMVN